MALETAARGTSMPRSIVAVEKADEIEQDLGSPTTHGRLTGARGDRDPHGTLAEVGTVSQLPCSWP